MKSVTHLCEICATFWVIWFRCAVIRERLPGNRWLHRWLFALCQYRHRLPTLFPSNSIFRIYLLCIFTHVGYFLSKVTIFYAAWVAMNRHTVLCCFSRLKDRGWNGLIHIETTGIGNADSCHNRSTLSVNCEVKLTKVNGQCAFVEFFRWTVHAFWCNVIR